MMKRSSVFLAVVCMLVALSGCTDVAQNKMANVIDEYRYLLQPIIVIGVGTALNQYPDLAPGFYDIASALANDTTASYTTVEVLMAEVRRRIEARPTYQVRPPNEKAAIQLVTQSMEALIAGFLAKRGINTTDALQVTLSDLGAWVRDAAQVYLPEPALLKKQ